MRSRLWSLAAMRLALLCICCGAAISADVGSAPVRDVLTGHEHPGGVLRVADLLAQYPVALLVTEGGKP